MKKSLPVGMVYINVDVPVSTTFRDAALQEDPELEWLALTLSRLLWEEITRFKESSENENGGPSQRGCPSSRTH